ncbi:MAG: hypothetical protein FWD79_08795 [Desulfobulbus sp.]|nr:hypothetical protein [Desulfobulbus sp.]
MLEHITGIEQLSALQNRVSEAMTQTAQQIRMVQQNIERYENMFHVACNYYIIPKYLHKII